jgi:murein DD-endopeptidase MepM/ murein hydrolase activator NlpD
MASVGALSAWIGYETGLRDSSTQGSRLLSSLHSMFATERVALDGEKQAVGEHLNALARKLGEMRAEVMRLEAMGQRLVVKRGLDPEEFDFSLPPALGGPGSESEWTTQAPDLMADFDQLSQRIEDRSHKLALLEGLLLSHEIREQTQPSGSPVAAGWISSRYGWRTDPFNGTRSHHRGVDFAGKSGSDIIAVADGVVTLAGMRSGFGKTIEIKHGNGYLTRYAHNHSLKVKKGDIVHQGQVIAAMGHSGRATGTHLHFEVIRDGKNIDPLRFVDAPQGKKKAG